MSDTMNNVCGAIGKMLKKSGSQILTDTTAKIVGIYGLRCKTTGKWYVGQSWNIYGRWYSAYKSLNCKGQRKLYHALKKYGYDDFEKCIIEMCDENIPQLILDMKEISWIKHYNAVDNGYNLTYGGKNCGKYSDETKLKISATKIGKKRKPFTYVHLQNMSNSQKYRSLNGCIVFTKEVKDKLSYAAKRRKPISDETRKKMSLSKIGNKNKIKKVLTITQ